MIARACADPLPIAICVPARNEAAALPQLFAALERLEPVGVTPILCLLLDSCRDASAAVAAEYAARASLPVVVREAAQPDANAGRARHAAMLIGEHALQGSGLLLTTDADSAWHANDSTMSASGWASPTMRNCRRTASTGC